MLENILWGNSAFLVHISNNVYVKKRQQRVPSAGSSGNDTLEKVKTGFQFQLTTCSQIDGAVMNTLRAQNWSEQVR